jgi:hypothetical protein
VLDELVQTL